MAGRGPAPKLGDKLGHRAKSKRSTRPGDGAAKRWPMPAGDWSPEAVRWWEAVTGSAAAEQAWAAEDAPKLERALWMVEQWWKLTTSNPAEAFRMSEVLRRAEAELYLSPAERARAGLVAERRDEPQRSAQASARGRLRSLDGGASAVG
jgi:hypothetical protein